MNQKSIAYIGVAVIVFVGAVTYINRQSLVSVKSEEADSEAVMTKPAVKPSAVVPKTQDMGKAPDYSVTDQMTKVFTEYASLHYPMSSVKSIKYDAMCDGSEAYDVALSSPKEGMFSIILSKDGQFIQIEKDAPVKDLPVVIQKLLKSDYPQYSYGDSYEALTMANGDPRYLVDLSNVSKKTTSELILAVDGKVLCQTKEK